MRKTAIFLFVMILVCMSVATACSNLSEKYARSMSDMRQDLLVYAGNDYEVTVVTGMRESEFSMDGESTDKIEYTVITITPLIAVSVVTVTVSINEVLYELNADQHPLGSTYSVEIEDTLQVNSLDMEISGTSLTAISVLPAEYISIEEALTVASMSLDLDNADEIYLRLIENPVTSDGMYYWYIAVYQDDSLSAVLVDIASGDIMAEK